MKWIFCLNEHATKNHNLFLSEMAILSVIKYTFLEPICLFEGNNEYFEQFLHKNNVKLIKIKENPVKDFLLSNVELLKGDSFRDILNFASGAFLRFEIFKYIEDKYCLYTDIDVLFTKYFKLPTLRPDIMMVCRQDQKNTNIFNSGVILFNLKAFSKYYKTLMEFVFSDLSWTKGMYDQDVLNQFFSKRVEFLDMSYNWRPLFGIEEHSKIIHFEIIKPFKDCNRKRYYIDRDSSYYFYENLYFKEMINLKL